ncbi:phage tail assembly protein T [Streptomyces tibetensis]|uniref:phage tail assembly protein T n=1 Tax=Streptomyces tibetensis TaxID=2382123 RepID=UPI0033CD0FBD
MLRTHSSAELTEWIAYERVTGPLGGARSDVQMAMLASVIANANRGKGSRVMKPADFLPKWDRGARQDWRQMLAAVKGINQRLGGTDTTQKTT